MTNFLLAPEQASWESIPELDQHHEHTHPLVLGLVKSSRFSKFEKG